jgi:hypothetical protein
MPFRIKYILCLETMVPDFVNIWENAMKNNLKIISAIAFLGLLGSCIGDGVADLM